MIDIEAHRSNEYAPQKAAIAGLPEQVGMTQGDVDTAILTTTSLDAARNFVSDYISHVKENIDHEHVSDAEALAKRHLIDYLYYVQAPVELKEGHPISLVATLHRQLSERLIVEAMIEIFEDEYPERLDERFPTNSTYINIKNSILEARRATLSA